MKSKLFLLLGLSIFTLSCSSDDSGNDNGQPATSFPATSANYWDYEVLNHATTNAPSSTANDHLFVGNDMLINNISFKEMKTSTAANGFFSGTLKDNGLRIDGNSVKVSGTVSFNAGLPTSLSFAISDFIILKENATTGDQLSITNGTFTQDFNGTPLTFEYKLKSIADGSQTSLTSNNKTYSNITKTKVVLNLKITATYSGFPITVMPAQDVLVSTQHYSKNIGMVYNLTEINYTLSTLPVGTQLPIPQSGSQTQEEFLGVYQLN